jgi:bacterioferritin
MREFKEKIEKIRERARQKMEEGAVTDSYGANKETVIGLLNEALATEIVCVLRYRFHYEASKGINSSSIAAEFKEHADDELRHVDWLAERISQLGGKPDYNPSTIFERSHTDYVEGESLTEMISEDLVAERIAIGVYQEFIRYLGNDDPTTRRILENILAEEEDHAEDLVSLITPMKEKETQKYQRSVA